MRTRDNDTARPRTMEFAAAIKAVDGPRRRLVGCASQEIEDLMGDIIVARGIETRDFMKNPVLLADHDRTFILGRVLRLWIEARPEGDALMFEAEVLPAGTSARVDERWAAIQAGAANGISIGFIGKESEQRQASGGRVGYKFTKTALLELSQVAIPACQTCLIEQRACPHGGTRDASDCPGIGRLGCVNTSSGTSCPAEDRCPMFGPAQTSWRDRGQEIILIDDAPDGFVLILDEEKVVPTNISTDREEPDADWNAPTLSDFTAKPWSALSDAERERIAKHYAWASEMPPRAFGSLKLPHHNPRTGKVNLHGVNNALARLPNTDIPTDEKGRVEAHLTAHQESFKGLYRTASGALKGIGPDGRELSTQELKAVIGAVMMDPEVTAAVVDHAAETIEATIGRLKGNADYCPIVPQRRGRRGN